MGAGEAVLGRLRGLQTGRGERFEGFKLGAYEGFRGRSGVAVATRGLLEALGGRSQGGCDTAARRLVDGPQAV